MELTPPLVVTRDKFDEMLAVVPEYARAIVLIARDMGCCMAMLKQDGEPFLLDTKGRPTAWWVHDDTDVSLGPDGFHEPSLTRALADCETAVIVSGAPSNMPYASVAAVVGIGRQSVFLVDTRLQHEQQWIDFLYARKPRSFPVLVSSIEPEGWFQ